MTFFCPLPFTAVDIGPNGQARPCCRFANQQSHTVTDYWSSAEMRDVRAQLLAGSAPMQCQCCVTEEALSGHSMRRMALMAQPAAEQIQRAQDPDWQEIDQILIGTSNVCNLQCLPCVDGASFVRSQELYDLGLISKKPVLMTTQIDLAAIPYTNQITRVTLVGGEPFVDRETRNLIDRMIELGLASKIDLFITTNLTRIEPQRLERLQAEFHGLTIKGSIDGIGAAHNYLRWPSDWSTIETAVDHIQRLGIGMTIHTALSNLALVQYDQILDWTCSRGLVDVFMSKVMTPAEMSFDRLPDQTKQRLLPRYQERLATFQGQTRTRFLLETLVDILSRPGCEPAAWQNTVAWLDLHDQRRGTDWRSIWPELAEIDHA